MRNVLYSNQGATQLPGQTSRSATPTTKTIPFDYVFQFALKGERGNKVQDVVEISMEGVFVALSIGYSLLLDETKPPRTFQLPVVDRKRVKDVTLEDLLVGLEKIGLDLRHGFRLNPSFKHLLDQSINNITPETLKNIFQTGAVGTEDVSFLYSLDVGGTGREYQNKPIHNLAGLGIANGDRPFRPFAKPIMFEPRSSIRIQIEEISCPPGTLYIVLQGYKILGTGRVPR
jgi:hypothetical protein